MNIIIYYQNFDIETIDLSVSKTSQNCRLHQFIVRMNDQSESDINHQDFHHHPSKHQLSNNDRQLAATKLTDLEFDSLAQIFVYLDLKSLFSVAVSNEWLRRVARAVYSYKFGTIPVNICNVQVYTNRSACAVGNLTPAVCWITVNEIKTCLQFLRSFGPSMRKLEIFYSDTSFECYDFVDQYINEYCAESLISISYYGKSHFSMKHFQRPFINVRRVQIIQSELNVHLALFVSWFPNLRQLDLFSVRIHGRLIEAAFPYLEHLSIQIGTGDTTFALSKANVTDLLRVNPQLQILSIDLPASEDLTLSVLLRIFNNNQNLNKLTLFTETKCNGATSEELMRFASIHQSLVELDLSRFEFKADDVIRFIHQLNSLKMFRFVLDQIETNSLVAQLDREWELSVYAVLRDYRNCCVITLNHKENVE